MRDLQRDDNQLEMLTIIREAIVLSKRDKVPVNGEEAGVREEWKFVEIISFHPFSVFHLFSLSMQ